MENILTHIITAIVSAICTGGLGWIFFFKSEKKTKYESANSAEIENLRKIIETLQHNYEYISKQLIELQAIVLKKNEEKKELFKKIEQLEHIIRALHDIIINHSCSTECKIFQEYQKYKNEAK
ncbi:MAG: hypothetical protein FWC39_07285 [Bacteroidetes bacterium]|nr:hypothetical protein [Bacteroidota bacterium]